MVQMFFQSLLIGYSGAMMPGSLLTYTIDKSMKSGPKTGLLISIGHLFLEIIIVIMLLSGTGSFLGTQAVQMVIGFLGGLLLIFLGINMVKDSYQNNMSIDLDAKSEKQSKNLIAGGFIVSLSNPYFLFWWAIVGLGLLLSAYTTFGIIGVIIFYFGHSLADISWYSFISVLISRTRRFINQKVYRIIIAILGLCLTGFGISFIVDSFKYLSNMV